LPSTVSAISRSAASVSRFPARGVAVKKIPGIGRIEFEELRPGGVARRLTPGGHEGSQRGIGRHHQLNAAQLEAIGRYVHDLGSGLMVVGGEKTFGDAVFHDTPLERLLPVTAAAAATETERSVLAMVLIIDRSGSMEQDRRLDLAKEAAQQSVRVLDAHDKAGVIAFSDDAEWIAPLATVADKADLLQRIATLTAYG
jgi:hypothetical protein